MTEDTVIYANADNHKQKNVTCFLMLLVFAFYVSHRSHFYIMLFKKANHRGGKEQLINSR